MLAHETLYVGIDIGKLEHVAGFVSRTLLSRYQRFESCPALTFEQSREGFRALLDRIEELVPLTQVYALLEVTGHYHKALLQYLHECEIPVYLMHVQKRQAGLLKSDKRDALGLAWRWGCSWLIHCKRYDAWSRRPQRQLSSPAWSTIARN